MSSSPRIRRRRAALGVVWIGVLGLVVGRELRGAADRPRQEKVAGWEFVFVEGQAVGVGARGDAVSPVDTMRIEAGWILRHEFRVRDYCRWLNEESPDGVEAHPQVEQSAGRWIPRDGNALKPLAFVGVEEADRISAWVGERSGLGGRGRLPREAEWMVAARAGTPGLPYAWGFAPPDPERACYGATATRPVGSYAANAWGLVDVCGNVAEWCRDDTQPNRWSVRGGSFAERDPRFLRVTTRVSMDPSYEDADVGFRVWIPARPKAKD